MDKFAFQFLVVAHFCSQAMIECAPAPFSEANLSEFKATENFKKYASTIKRLSHKPKASSGQEIPGTFGHDIQPYSDASNNIK